MNSQEILFCLSKPREIPGRVNYPLTEEDKKDIALINWIKEQKKDKHYLRSLEEVANEVLMERNFMYGKSHHIVQPLICLLVENKLTRVLDSIVMEEVDEGNQHYNINYWMSGVWGAVCDKCSKIELYHTQKNGSFTCRNCK